MAPSFPDGVVVLVDPFAYDRRAPAPGDVVHIRHPYRRDATLIKRVSRTDARGNLFLLGDNTDESTDSRSFGAVSPTRLLGRVTRRLA